MADQKLWTVPIRAEIVVLAETASEARKIAKKNKSEALENAEVEEPERLFAGYGLPTGWDERTPPYVADADDDELTIGEIRKAAVQEFVDAG